MEESDDEEDDEPYVDDPFGLNRLAVNYQPARIGAKRFTVDPESVVVNDFVIVRAKPDEADGSCFKIGDYDVPVWLCKVRCAVEQICCTEWESRRVPIWESRRFPPDWRSRRFPPS